MIKDDTFLFLFALMMFLTAFLLVLVMDMITVIGVAP